MSYVMASITKVFGIMYRRNINEYMVVSFCLLWYSFIFEPNDENLIIHNRYCYNASDCKINKWVACTHIMLTISISILDRVHVIEKHKQFLGMKFTSNHYPISYYYKQGLQVSHIVFTNSIKRLVTTILYDRSLGIFYGYYWTSNILLL